MDYYANWLSVEYSSVVFTLVEQSTCPCCCIVVVPFCARESLSLEPEEASFPMLQQQQQQQQQHWLMLEYWELIVPDTGWQRLGPASASSTCFDHHKSPMHPSSSSWHPDSGGYPLSSSSQQQDFAAWNGPPMPVSSYPQQHLKWLPHPSVHRWVPAPRSPFGLWRSLWRVYGGISPTIGVVSVACSRHVGYVPCRRCSSACLVSPGCDNAGCVPMKLSSNIIIPTHQLYSFVYSLCFISYSVDLFSSFSPSQIITLLLIFSSWFIPHPWAHVARQVWPSNCMRFVHICCAILYCLCSSSPLDCISIQTTTLPISSHSITCVSCIICRVGVGPLHQFLNLPTFSILH